GRTSLLLGFAGTCITECPTCCANTAITWSQSGTVLQCADSYSYHFQSGYRSASPSCATDRDNTWDIHLLTPQEASRETGLCWERKDCTTRRHYLISKTHK